jgi:penicillin-binding protein 1A
LVRAGLAIWGVQKVRGASAITMQVARNVYLSAEKKVTPQICEIL